MIDLKKEQWIEKDVDAEQIPGVKAKFKRLKMKEYRTLHEADLSSVTMGTDSEVRKLVLASIKDIEGVNMGDVAATIQEVLDNGGVALASAFTTALVVAQYDKDFLAK